MNLQQKWDALVSEASRRGKQYIESLYPNPPDKFYKVYYTGKHEEFIITGSHYQFPFPIYPTGKKPTKADVQKLSDSLSKPMDFLEDMVYFDYYYIWDSKTGQKATTAIKGADLHSEGTILSEEEARQGADIVKAKWEEDQAWKALHKKDANYDYQSNGYKFLGWQNGWRHVYFDKDGNVATDEKLRKSFGYLTADYPEYGKCRDAKHRTISVQHDNRGSENTVSCPECKIYYKYDCSD